MADVTRTIGATTGDSASIGDALTWMKNSANYDRSTDDVGILQIVDAQEFNEDTLDFSGFTGTATSSKYIRFETVASLWSDGIDIWPSESWDSTNPGIRSTGGDHIIYLKEPYLHFKHLNIFQESSGQSDECMTFRNAGVNVTDVVVEKCFFKTTAFKENDCIYAVSTLNYSFEVLAYDCVFLPSGYGTGSDSGSTGPRAGVHFQSLSHDTALTCRAIHCTAFYDDAREGGGFRSQITAGRTGQNFYCWNNVAIGVDSAYTNDYGNNSSVDATWTGTGNLESTNNAADTFGTTGNWQSVSYGTAGTEDFSYTSSSNLLVVDGTGNDYAIEGAVDFSGTYTIDPRVDDDTDIAGTTRNATLTDRDCGAFEIVSGSDTTVTQTNSEAIAITVNDTAIAHSKTIAQTATETVALTVNDTTVGYAQLVDQGSSVALGVTVNDTTIAHTKVIDQTSSNLITTTVNDTTVGYAQLVAQGASDTISITVNDTTVDGTAPALNVQQDPSIDVAVSVNSTTIAHSKVIDQGSSIAVGLTANDTTVGYAQLVDQGATQTLGITVNDTTVNGTAAGSSIVQQNSAAVSLVVNSTTVGYAQSIAQTASDAISIVTNNATITFAQAVAQAATKTLGLVVNSTTVEGTSDVVLTYTIDGAGSQTITSNYGSLKLYDSGGGSYFTW